MDHNDHDQPYLLGPDPLAQMRCAIPRQGELSQMTVRQGLRKRVAHPQQLPTCGVADMGQSPIMRDHAPVLSDRKTTCDCCAIAQALAIFASAMLSDLSLSVGDTCHVLPILTRGRGPYMHEGNASDHREKLHVVPVSYRWPRYVQLSSSLDFPSRTEPPIPRRIRRLDWASWEGLEHLSPAFRSGISQAKTIDYHLLSIPTLSPVGAISASWASWTGRFAATYILLTANRDRPVELRASCAYLSGS